MTDPLPGLIQVPVDDETAHVVEYALTHPEHYLSGEIPRELRDTTVSGASPAATAVVIALANHTYGMAALDRTLFLRMERDADGEPVRLVLVPAGVVGMSEDDGVVIYRFEGEPVYRVEVEG